MSFADLVAEELQRRRKRRADIASMPQPEPGIGARVLDTVLSGAEPVFSALDWTGRHTRAAAANIAEALGRAPIERTGKETWFGRAPSGRELAGLGTGTLGKFESGDILGFGVEALADPINLLGIGALSKGGKLAKQLAGAQRVIKSVESMGPAARKLAEPTYLAAKTLEQKLLKEGAGQLGKTLAEQGKLGQRSLLSLHVPFTRFDAALPVVGGKAASRLGLGGLGAVGRGIRFPFEASGIAKKFRLEGRIGDDTWDAIADEAQNIMRERAGTGRERSALMQSFIAAQPTEIAAQFANFEQALVPAIGDAQTAYMRMGRAAGLPSRAIQRQLMKYDVLQGIEGGLEDSPANLMMSLGMQKAWLPGLRERQVAVVAHLRERIKPLQELETALRQSRDPNILKQQIMDLKDRLAAAPDPKAQRLIRRKIQAIIDAYGAGKGFKVSEVLKTDAAELGAKIRGLEAKLKHGETKGFERALANITGKMDNLRLRAAAEVTRLRGEGKVADAVVAALPADMRAEVLRQTALTGERLAMEQMAGVPVAALHDPALAYLPRITTPEFREWAKRQDIGSSWNRMYRMLETRGPFTEMRTKEWEGFTSWQIEGMAQADGFKGNVFIENVSDAVLKRELMGAKSSSHALMLQGAIRAFHTTPQAVALTGQEGVPIERVLAAINRGKTRITRLGEESLEAVEDVLGVRVETGATARTPKQIRKALEGTRYEGSVIPRDIANALLEHGRIATVPEELERLNGFIDKYLSSMRYWVTSAAVTIPGIKAMGTLAGTAVGGAAGAAIGGATAGVSGAIAGGVTGAGLGLMATKFGALPLFPQYHMRNAMSNAFMMWLADFRDPRYMYRAWKAINEYENILSGPGGADAFKYASKDVQAIRHAMTHGAFGEGQTGELANLLRMAHPDQPTTPLGRIAAPITAPGTTRAGQAGLNIGNRIENTSKLALFIEGMEKKGLTVGEAADRVKKFLFNYSDLSPFEKKTLRRWAFFYTWERKALPLMWEQLVTNPRKMRLWGLATGQITDSEQERDLREYQKARNPFYGGQGPGGARIFWDLGLPPSELFAFSGENQPGWGGVRRALQKVAGRTAPVLRGPAELITGVDLASGQPATAQRALLGLTPATRVARLLQNISGTLKGETSDTGGWPLLGFSPIRANANTAANQKKLDAMNAWLANERFMGRMREWKGYKAVEKAQEPFYAPHLKYRRKLEEALEKQRQ